MVKDYGYLFRNDPRLAAQAARISSLARDVTEVASELGFKSRVEVPKLRVAYHSACSLQHGQKVTNLPFDLLSAAGFEALAVPEGHICCGSAGTYNLLQPEIAIRLRDRKLDAIRSTGCDVVAAGNIGCMTQIRSAFEAPPVVHTIELLDWASGGRKPPNLRSV
jgi:glycolate oxidase iron-sulfur subunit